jgi:hypothetical protein
MGAAFGSGVTANIPDAAITIATFPWGQAHEQDGGHGSSRRGQHGNRFRSSAHRPWKPLEPFQNDERSFRQDPGKRYRHPYG